MVKPKRGRPSSGGRDPLMGFRASSLLRGAIVKWAERHPDHPSLSEAVRRLVELGLTVKANKPKQAPAERAARAKELASKTIDKVAGAPDNDEKATRKARLIKGPEEFRELRADHAKAKGSPK